MLIKMIIKKFSKSFIVKIILFLLQKDTIMLENYWSPVKHLQIIRMKKTKVANRKPKWNPRITRPTQKQIVVRPRTNQRAIDRVTIHQKKQKHFGSTLRTHCCYRNLWNCRSWIYFWMFGRIFYYFVTIIG
jgi:hypothetical protein